MSEFKKRIAGGAFAIAIIVAGMVVFHFLQKL